MLPRFAVYGTSVPILRVAVEETLQRHVGAHTEKHAIRAASSDGELGVAWRRAGFG